MHLYLDKPDGYKREDFESEIKAMTHEAMQAEAKAYGLQEAVNKLKDMLIEEVLKEAEIKKGDKCVMHFTDGDQTVKFVEAADGVIYVHHCAATGKPHKSLAVYDYTYAELLEKTNDGVPQ